MCAKENNNKEKTASSSDFESGHMDEKMSQMMNMCCTGRKDFSDCFTMMKNMMDTMKNQTPPAKEEADKQSGDINK